MCIVSAQPPVMQLLCLEAGWRHSSLHTISRQADPPHQAKQVFLLSLLSPLLLCAGVPLLDIAGMDLEIKTQLMASLVRRCKGTRCARLPLPHPVTLSYACKPRVPNCLRFSCPALPDLTHVVVKNSAGPLPYCLVSLLSDCLPLCAGPGLWHHDPAGRHLPQRPTPRCDIE